MKTCLRSLLFLISAALAACGGQSLKDTPQSGVKDMATKASADVGVVTRTGDGSRGARVIVLEEFHNSRASQIQHALTMVRLHDQFGLRRIALEGYLKDRPPVDLSWFHRLTQNASDRTRVAVQLLKEGEVSGAEFVGLAFPDVTLDPIEDSKEYDVQFTEGAPEAMLQLANQLDPKLAAQIGAKLEQAITSPLPADEQLAMAEDLERRRIEKRLQLAPNVQRDWDSWLSFWRGRAGGSKTMVEATAVTADSAGQQVVAMNIGAAHTEDVAKLLAAVQRPFAVVTPLALKQDNHAGDLEDGFDRKYEKKSVFKDGFLTAVWARLKKPQPVVGEAWLQAKANVYLLVDRVVQGAAAGGGQPPFGLGPDALRLPFASVDPTQISLAGGGASGNGGGRGPFLFPVVLNPDDDRRRSTVWVKAAPMAGQERNVDGVEAMLKQALSEVQTEAKASTTSEDSNGQVQVTTRTTATFAADRAEANRRILRGV